MICSINLYLYEKMNNNDFLTLYFKTMITIFLILFFIVFGNSDATTVSEFLLNEKNEAGYIPVSDF